MRILPLFIPHQGCPFECIYCDQFSITRSDADTADQFSKLINDFCQHNPSRNKEIAFFGGTFTALKNQVQNGYIDLVKPFREQIRGIRISTRPDFINDEIIYDLKTKGISTIELGIQSFTDKVLQASRRGYTSETAEHSCRLISADSGIDLIIQLMPGLPQDSLESFMNSLSLALKLKPAGIRLYPTVVLKNTALADWFEKGKFFPLELETAVQWLKLAHLECRMAGIPIIKMGLHSDIPPDRISAGPYHPAIGELVKIELLFDVLAAGWQKGKVISIPSSQRSLFLGYGKKLVKKLKKKLLLDKIAVCENKDSNQKEISFVEDKAESYW